jgi:hypothetical protein
LGFGLPAGSLAATEVDAAAKEISRIAAIGFIGLLLFRPRAGSFQASPRLAGLIMLEW